MIIMNIDNVKSFLGVACLDFQNVLNEEGLPTPWYKAWINNSRTAVLVHEDLKDGLRTSKKLSLKNKGEKIAQNGESYKTYIIVEYNDVAFSV